MRLTTATFWSPLPPARSGVADYSAGLLEALSAVADVTAAAEEPDTVVAPCGVKVLTVKEAADVPGLPVYHLADDSDLAWVYHQALRKTGVLVLHDTSLLALHRDLFGGMDSAGFRNEVRHSHGPVWGEPHDPALLDGWPAVEVDGAKLPDRRVLSLERRLVEASVAVVVHDPFSRAWLSERYPHVPIRHLPHGASPRLGDGGRSRIRTEFGWSDERVVFGVFGELTTARRVQVAVSAFATARRRWPDARLVVAGTGPDAEFAALADAVDHYGLADSVVVERDPELVDLRSMIAAADVVVDLTWPNGGGTHQVLPAALATGSVVVASDVPHYRHLDPRSVRLVPTEPAAEAEAVLAQMEHALRDPSEVREAGETAAEQVVRATSWAMLAPAWKALLAEFADPGDVCAGRRRASAGRRSAPVRRRPASVGVNVFADPRATTGLSESARRHASALARTGWPMTFTEFNTYAPNRTVPVPAELADLRGGKTHPVDLWMVNVNEFPFVPRHALDRYTIALWAWEFPQVLDDTLDQIARLDELWVVSSFVGEAFRTVTDLPITVIPNVVTQFDDVRPDRARFGLEDDELVVLFSFSASSSDARKNPWGVIEAFRKACAGYRGRARLVIKAIDLQTFPELTDALSAAVAGVDGVLIHEDLTREEMDSLLASCDIYMSLHRSEGFGMGMAEAMSLGKAVIATGYGGNTDFMPPAAAAVVGYQIRPIVAADHRYGEKFASWYLPGKLWAEPDVDQAARWLRKLLDSARLRAEMGRNGAAAVRALCSPDAVGAAMQRRLAELGAAPRGRVTR